MLGSAALGRRVVCFESGIGRVRSFPNPFPIPASDETPARIPAAHRPVAIGAALLFSGALDRFQPVADRRRAGEPARADRRLPAAGAADAGRHRHARDLDRHSGRHRADLRGRHAVRDRRGHDPVAHRHDDRRDDPLPREPLGVRARHRRRRADAGRAPAHRLSRVSVQLHDVPAPRAVLSVRRRHGRARRGCAVRCGSSSRRRRSAARS